MNTRMTAAVTMTLLLGGSVMSSTARLQVVDSIQGTSLRVIQAALPAFEQRNLDVTHYRIRVIHDQKSYVVVFTDKDARPDVRGAAGKHPGYEVEIDPVGLRVIRSNFIR